MGEGVIYFLVALPWALYAGIRDALGVMTLTFLDFPMYCARERAWPWEVDGGVVEVGPDDDSQH